MREAQKIQNLKYLASWISGIRYFKGTHIQSNYLASNTLSLIQTKLVEKTYISKKSTFIIFIFYFRLF